MTGGYPQLYSQVGFVHQFHSLSIEEVRFILEHKWQQIGVRLQPDDFSDMEAVARVIRITGGNFRLVHRLCSIYSDTPLSPPPAAQKKGGILWEHPTGSYCAGQRRSRV